ncbi:MAG TPA: hypothetical protein VM901_09885 [Bdellovibrionota bacterium]|nr:hypothetical protein [Bdellovibrionota bacterium]
MKVVWLISGDDASCARLQKELDRSSAPYLVRHATKISQIPSEHLDSTGVAALIDSFHIEHTGFEGLKELRDLGFKGPIFMFGEPAPEKTTVPFTTLELSGFFPAIERADLSYIAGIIHHSFALATDIHLPLFLSPEHKAGSAKIAKQEDLDAITQKLSLFAGRFGVKEETLKKALMGLCMGHIRSKHGESQIDEAFELRFGTDRNKIVLSVPAHSKGNLTSVLRNEFAQALSNFHNSTLKTSVLFQEFHHLVKAVNNLSILGGTSKAETEFADPMFLVTRIHFGTPAQTAGHLGYYFSIHHVKPSTNLDPATAHLPLIEAKPSVPVAETNDLSRMTVTSHSEKDLSEILNDPIVIGDTPEKKGERISLTSSANQNAADEKDKQARLTDDETIVNKNYLEKLRNDFTSLKELNEIMSQDVFRLTKERKEPTLDTELRKQNEELKAKLAKAEAEFAVALKILNQQIDELRGSETPEKKDAKSGDKKKAA